MKISFKQTVSLKTHFLFADLRLGTPDGKKKNAIAYKS